MHAGLRPQICAQIFQREYVPAQEHNYVVPRGAGPAHNAQRRLYVWAHAPFGVRISAGPKVSAYVPWFWVKSLKTAYFEQFSQKNANFLQFLCTQISGHMSAYLPWFQVVTIQIVLKSGLNLKKIAIFVQTSFLPVCAMNSGASNTVCIGNGPEFEKNCNFLHNHICASGCTSGAYVPWKQPFTIEFLL